MSAAIAAALMAAVAWTVLAGGFATNAGGAVVVAVAASLEAALLAAAGIGGIWALLLAPLLALAAIVPTTIGAMPFDGTPSVGHVIGRYANALSSGLASTSDWQFIVGLCALLWICGFWTGWFASRQRRGVLAVVPLFAVAATVVLNTKNVDNLVLPVALTVCLSLVLIADTHLDSVLARASGAGLASLPGTRSRFALTTAMVSVVLTVVALLIPSVSSNDISSRFFPGGSTGTTHSAQVGAANIGISNVISFSGATIPGGALVSQPQPVLEYRSNTGAPLYLRVINDTVFSSGGWFPEHPGQTALGAAWGGVPYTPGPLPWDRSKGAAAPDATQQVRAVIVMQAGATGNTSLTPMVGEPIAVDAGGVAFGEMPSAAIGATSSALDTIDSVEITAGVQSGTTITATGLVSAATTAQLRSAGTDYPAFVHAFTDLPDDGTNGASVITQLARDWTRGLTNPYDEAAAIEARLRSPQFHYTLSPPAAPAGEWPIVYFLSSSHSGYCQYFASAMGAMLRSLGIPTRVVNGYGPGTQQESQHSRQDKYQLVTTSDAHSWVEAYFPKYGWIPFEPTPPSSDGQYQPIPRGVGATSTPPPSSAPATPPSDVRPGFGETPGGGSASAQGVQHAVSFTAVLLWMLVAVAALLLVIAVWLGLARTPRGMWRRIEALGAAWGARRHPWETQREYVSRLPVRSASTRDALQELAALAARAEYSRAGVDHAGMRRGRALWRRVLFAAPRLTLMARREGVRAM